jgi:hypothetical protein
VRVMGRWDEGCSDDGDDGDGDDDDTDRDDSRGTLIIVRRICASSTSLSLPALPLVPTAKHGFDGWEVTRRSGWPDCLRIGAVP